MILVDTNVLMYAFGADHPSRGLSADFLEAVSEGELEASIDAEVLQEILHRYRAINRLETGFQIFDDATEIFSQIVPISRDEMIAARTKMEEYTHLSARDAIHIAVAEVHGMEAICTYDQGFKNVSSVPVLEPGEIL